MLIPTVPSHIQLSFWDTTYLRLAGNKLASQAIVSFSSFCLLLPILSAFQLSASVVVVWISLACFFLRYGSSAFDPSLRIIGCNYNLRALQTSLCPTLAVHLHSRHSLHNLKNTTTSFLTVTASEFTIQRFPAQIVFAYPSFGSRPE
ncbi:hypothetical protein RU639_004781 [Aspergillus parasiticus]